MKLTKSVITLICIIVVALISALYLTINYGFGVKNSLQDLPLSEDEDMFRICRHLNFNSINEFPEYRKLIRAHRILRSTIQNHSSNVINVLNSQSIIQAENYDELYIIYDIFNNKNIKGLNVFDNAACQLLKIVTDDNRPLECDYIHEFYNELIRYLKDDLLYLKNITVLLDEVMGNNNNIFQVSKSDMKTLQNCFKELYDSWKTSLVSIYVYNKPGIETDYLFIQEDFKRVNITIEDQEEFHYGGALNSKLICFENSFFIFQLNITNFEDLKWERTEKEKYQSIILQFCKENAFKLQNINITDIYSRDNDTDKSIYFKNIFYKYIDIFEKRKIYSEIITCFIRKMLHFFREGIILTLNYDFKNDNQTFTLYSYYRTSIKESGYIHIDNYIDVNNCENVCNQDKGNINIEYEDDYENIFDAEQD